MGKTSLLIQMLAELEKSAERPLFVMGIPDLKIEHIVAPPVREWTELRPSPEDPTLSLAYFTFPPNSILVVDEAQRVYRPRASSSKVPPEVAALETHRHTGLDIILLTQKPKLIDINVRELVGKHIHIRAGLVGRFLYEWPHIADGESRLDRADAARRKFTPPKKSFAQYKSAELHTKSKFRVHQGFIYLGLAILALGFELYNVSGIFNRHQEKVAISDSHTVKAVEPPTRTGAARSSTASTLQILPASFTPNLVESMTPKDPENPLSAPLYAELKPDVVAPKIEVCISSRKACTCYSQQQTPIWVPDVQCRNRAGGKYYDPYRPAQLAGQTGLMPEHPKAPSATVPQGLEQLGALVPRVPQAL